MIQDVKPICNTQISQKCCSFNYLQKNSYLTQSPSFTDPYTLFVSQCNVIPANHTDNNLKEIVDLCIYKILNAIDAQNAPQTLDLRMLYKNDADVPLLVK
jgi:hypothetical protein